MLLIPAGALATPLQEDLETAAIIGAGLMLCDLNKTGVGSGGWGHYIMVGSDKMHISQEAATEFVEARTREIIKYLNEERKLDEFCNNIRG